MSVSVCVPVSVCVFAFVCVCVYVCVCWVVASSILLVPPLFIPSPRFATQEPCQPCQLSSYLSFVILTALADNVGVVGGGERGEVKEI